MQLPHNPSQPDSVLVALAEREEKDGGCQELREAERGTAEGSTRGLRKPLDLTLEGDKY